jgi:transposase
MTREGLDSLDREALFRLILAQAETIAALTQQCEALLARVAELEAKLGLPPKTPDNSSTPPSKGQKPSAPAVAKDVGKRKSHAGAHRPLHPNPTTERVIFANDCQHCGTDVSQGRQLACEAYDHIDIPPIKPHVIRVTLYGGAGPCCAKKFKTEPPADMPKGTALGQIPTTHAAASEISVAPHVGLSRVTERDW